MTDFFHFFRDVKPGETDFDFGEVADDLGLTRPQKILLRRMLNNVEINVWFADKDDTTADTYSLTVNTFWDDGGFIASTDLIDMLNIVFKNRNDIGDEKEIAALKRLRAVVDSAIAERERAPA